MASSSAINEAAQTIGMKLLKASSAGLRNLNAETETECPLRGAEFDSLTHFGKEIKTLELSKEYFEDADQGIVEYSQLLTAENDKLGIYLDERMVNHLFTIQVLELWDFGSPMTEKLLSQVMFPASKI